MSFATSLLLLVERTLREVEATLSDEGRRAMTVGNIHELYSLDALPERVRHLGCILHESGGIGLLRRVHQTVRRDAGAAAERLALLWNGIGEWRCR